MAQEKNNMRGGAKPRALTGVGIKVALDIRNVKLWSSLTATFERADSQLQYLQVTAPAMVDSHKVQAVRDGLARIFADSSAEISADAGQLEALAEGQGIQLVLHPGRSAEVALHAPLSRQLLDLYRAADDANGYLDAAWVAGIVDDKQREEKAKEIRTQLGNVIQGIDKLYTRLRGEANQGKKAA